MANLVTLQGENQPFIRNVMTLNTCSPIVGVDVMSFDTERDLLLAWRVLTLALLNVLSWLHFFESFKFSSKYDFVLRDWYLDRGFLGWNLLNL